MKGYIYQIECIAAKKSYIGQTVDIKRRKRDHFNDLKNNRHINKKLQNAWNKYGENEFHFRFWEFEINSPEELNLKECEYIKKFNSLEDGYNLVPGGGKPPLHQKVKNEDIIKFLCIQHFYGSGYGKTSEEIFNWSKGTASAAKRKVRFIEANNTFEKMSEEEKIKIAKETYKEKKFAEVKMKRQLSQGGCQKSYQLSLEDYFFAFRAQELGYGYTTVANYLGVKPATVKDWFNKRARKKEREQFNKLSETEKHQLDGRVKIAELSGNAKSVSST